MREVGVVHFLCDIGWLDAEDGWEMDGSNVFCGAYVSLDPVNLPTR